MKPTRFHLIVAATLAISPTALAQQGAAPGTTTDPRTDPTMGRAVDGTKPRPPEGAVPTPNKAVTSPAPGDTEVHGSPARTRATDAPPGTRANPTESPHGRPNQAATPPGTPPTPPATGTPPATPGTGTAGSAATVDIEVMQKLHQANQHEIDAAKMAVDKAESPRVKAYAKKILADHTAADKQLMAHVERLKIERSQVETAATPGADPAKEHAAKLEAAGGAAFDREYVNMMMAEHDKAIEMVKSAKETVTDKKLKSMLTSLLPKLERHKKMAQDLAEKHLKT